MNLWQKNKVFAAEVIQPLFDLADPNHHAYKEIAASSGSNGNYVSFSHLFKYNKNKPKARYLWFVLFHLIHNFCQFFSVLNFLIQLLSS